MNKLPTLRLVNFSKQKGAWDFGNNILYDLCRNNYSHKNDEHILTKVLFIGRIYAVAVERRKIKKANINDDFYIDFVSPAFRKSKLDEKLVKLKRLKTLRAKDLQSILQTHNYLTMLLKEITNLDKRSFSSKYLHFHLPNLFFIYDSRAVKALRQFKSKLPRDLMYLTQLEDIDKEYAKFYCKCFDLKRNIERHYNTTLTTRQLDKILIEAANGKNRIKYL